MARTWAFCLEPDVNGNGGNFVEGSHPPNHGVFWVTGDITTAAPYTFCNVIFLAADNAPTFYDGDQIFYAVGGVPSGLAVQDIVVTLGRLRNVQRQATVGSPVKFGSGLPRCILNKDVNGGSLTTVVLPGPGSGTTTFSAIGPFPVQKDPGAGGRTPPAISQYESLVVARVGTSPTNITAEFAFDPEADVDNGL